MLRILTFLCWTGLLVSATSQEAAQPALQTVSPQSNASVVPSAPLIPPRYAPLHPYGLPGAPDVPRAPNSGASEAAQPPRPDAGAPVAPRQPTEAPKPPATSVSPDTAKTEASSTENPAPSTQSSSAPTQSTVTPTAEPSTSSVAPTSSPKPSTTSEEPKSSTAAPPAPTTPLPPVKAGKWVVNETGRVCVVAQMAVQFDVGYLDANSTKSHIVFNLPADQSTQATGNCGSTEQNLTLSWMATSTGWNNLTLHFVKNDSRKHYTLHHLELSMPGDEFPKANFTKPVVLTLQEPAFSTGVNNSYRCLMQQKLALKTPDSNDTSGVLTVSDLQFQAFKTGNSTVFDLAKDCAFDTPDVVPIVVGCALAGLVVVVLIAYLVGRRRSQVQGYVSM